MGFPLLHLLFSVLLLHPFHTSAQNNATIAVGSTLTAADPTNQWVSSPSGDFAFGFRQLQDTDHFILCIWYANLHERTIVWHANTSGPVPQGSTVRLEPDSGLILRDPQGKTLWTPDNLRDFKQVDRGFLNDTGSFVLVESDSTVLWDTFDHPTDTLLPTQEMEIGTMLISRRSEANFSHGRFYLQMRDDGNLVLFTKTLPENTFIDREYYSSQTSDPANKTNSGLKLIFSSDGSISILKRSSAKEVLSPPRSSTLPESYLRLTLEFDGVLILYRISKNSADNQTWTSSLRSQPDNICTAIYGMDNLGSGACGYNSICSLDANKRPSCQCPPYYSLIDPSDKYGSCKPNFIPPTCDEPGKGSSEDLYELIELPDTDWPANDREGINQNNTFKEECKMACLNDCLCAAAVYAFNGCWKKRLPMSNGLRDTNRDLTGFIKVRKSVVPPLNPVDPLKFREKDQGTLILAGSVLLGTSVFINFLFITAACLGFFLIYKGKIKKLTPTKASVQSNLHHFSYKELVEATNGFKEELGRGASAIVYKGEMSVASRNIVAVKKLDRVAHDSEKEFMSEVTVIGQTHHKHLVRLLGYCNEDQHQILVYEYMSNGTLANFLFSDLTPSWSQRIKIALGIARGLTYLHEECSSQIIHCDIKPQNILLDDYYNARISDFGLAKLLRMNESRTQTNIRGTKGYVAPEWFRNNKVTAKVDVYSFGVLLMEIITCRRNVEDVERCGEDKAILSDWVIDCFEEKRLDLLVGNDEETLNDREKLERFVMISVWCIQEDCSLRPTMRKVSQMLEGVVQVPVPPNPNPFTNTHSFLSLE